MINRVMKTSIVFFSIMFFSINTSAADDKKKPDTDLIQATFGITSLDREDSTLSATNEEESISVESTIDTLPTFGVMGQMALWGDLHHAGIEGGVDGAWRRDTTRIVTSNGTLITHVDNSMYLINLYYGLYGSLNLGSKARIYAGAGGMLNWGNVDIESDSDTLTDESVSAFGFGPYARTGIEFALPDRSLIGIGCRWLKSDIDLSSSYGKIKAEGVQFLLTFTGAIPSGKL
jgi:hypothetical protein